MKTKAALFSVLLLCAALAGAGEGAAPAKKRVGRSRSSGSNAQAGVGGKGAAAHRARFEAALKSRLAKITAAHTARMNFFAREGGIWQTFWTKVKDDRTLFEVRLARQALALFDSLASLDPHDHASTIANYEKMQSDVMKSFELQQKQKMADFFAERDARWRQFAADQERDRADFAAEGEAAWQEHKAAEKGETRAAKKAPEAGASSVEAALEPPAPGEDAPAAKPSPAPAPSRASVQEPLKIKAKKPDLDDKWH